MYCRTEGQSEGVKRQGGDRDRVTLWGERRRKSIKTEGRTRQSQSSGAVWKSRWPSWAPVPNKPTVYVHVKQHSTNLDRKMLWGEAWRRSKDSGGGRRNIDREMLRGETRRRSKETGV